MRPIDCHKAKKAIYEHGTNMLRTETVLKILDSIPTLTQPNEWAQVLEAINNEAVAYIEGGPYKNDLPGMELALKIDRLSRDFVRPPEGEEDK